ncbi:hypothetical protein D3C75_751390 [compost metagenome]
MSPPRCPPRCARPDRTSASCCPITRRCRRRFPMPGRSPNCPRWPRPCRRPACSLPKQTGCRCCCSTARHSTPIRATPISTAMATTATTTRCASACCRASRHCSARNVRPSAGRPMWCTATTGKLPWPRPTSTTRVAPPASPPCTTSPSRAASPTHTWPTLACPNTPGASTRRSITASCAS